MIEGAHAKRQKFVRIRIGTSPAWKSQLRTVCLGLAAYTFRELLSELNVGVIWSILAKYVVIHNARETRQLGTMSFSL